MWQVAEGNERAFQDIKAEAERIKMKALKKAQEEAGEAARQKKKKKKKKQNMPDEDES